MNTWWKSASQQLTHTVFASLGKETRVIHSPTSWDCGLGVMGWVPWFRTRADAQVTNYIGAPYMWGASLLGLGHRIRGVGHSKPSGLDLPSIYVCLEWDWLPWRKKMTHWYHIVRYSSVIFYTTTSAMCCISAMLCTIAIFYAFYATILYTTGRGHILR